MVQPKLWSAKKTWKLGSNLCFGSNLGSVAFVVHPPKLSLLCITDFLVFLISTKFSNVLTLPWSDLNSSESGLNCMPLDVVGGSLLEDVDPPGLVVDPNNLSANLSLASPSPSMTPVTPSGSQGSDQEWNYDPNEPRYCVCNQVNSFIHPFMHSSFQPFIHAFIFSTIHSCIYFFIFLLFLVFFYIIIILLTVTVIDFIIIIIIIFVIVIVIVIVT